MCEKKIEYVPFDEFVSNSKVKESTIKRNYKRIPGISKKGSHYSVLSGTRYPYNLRGTKLTDSASKRYVLLKAISKYKYISHKKLRIEHKQFEKMLRDLLSAGLIEYNNLSNVYGANAYDCTTLGDDFINRKDKAAKSEMINLISSAAGTFTGAVFSKVFNEM